ncbi:hypothetical protein [Streptomyces sp. HGB0020]|jgi:hypothetical protein|uniref:hypothetical protein n=1 Tax=Streptomyces sp. HGB0020 TaxID=1078086 RepID=UPI00034EAAE1|nr:hypothetical protein [Streptomyces sp. HGB0020]EPD56173.1 hypothetical protein HMPREF1211_07291 [Streptomyces sp. HGB0020]
MPGTVLLLAASPAGKGALVDAASVLPVLAAVPPGVLSGTDTANVVELADPLEPQAVLTRLRAAAAAPGPLTVFVTGQLQLDRRQRLPHLALARTTPSTVRYTGLPWHWIREELRLRAPGSATLIVDLHADPEMWEWLRSNPLDAGRTVAVYGRIAPPPSRRSVGVPAYMKAVATILRSGWRPEVPQLHEQALARVGVGGYGDLVLASGGVVAGVPEGFAPRPPYRPEGPRPHTPDGLKGADPGSTGSTGEGDPHSVISAAVQAGRHSEADALAARHEQAAVQAHGPGSEEALHWAEVRADLAMFAGDPVRSCRTWLGVAAARLAAGQAPDGPAVESAVDRAHHQWGQVQDAAMARELGASLAELRSRVPGRRQGALDHVQRQLRQLQTQG